MLNNNMYNINNWGDGYFHINAKGNIEVQSTHCASGVELQAIVNAAHEKGLTLPILIRFIDILQDRVKLLYNAFSQAITNTAYKGNYQLVFPIKVNQEYRVVAGLLATPNKHIGLEVGSKPELMAVIGLVSRVPTTIVCNGYKDSTYIRTALISQQIGHNVLIIIEKISELETILHEAREIGVTPTLGVRIRLTTTCEGKWQHTGGAKSKFGLNISQVLQLIEQLRAQNSIHTLQLIHCHLGSQIANIDDIKACMAEVVRYYVELRNLNAPINTIDVGGGLAVDYEGTKTSTDCSMNYNYLEYATSILTAVRNACAHANLPEPNIISESGRALTAHHAVLITNITDIETGNNEALAISTNDAPIVTDLFDIYNKRENYTPIFLYEHGKNSLLNAHLLFTKGEINIQTKAKVELLVKMFFNYIVDNLNATDPTEKQVLHELQELLATKVFCNLSFFQSIPDAWAIGQIFPIAPITALNQAPVVHSILQDLTCDSDGTLKQYSGSADIKSTLLLPPYNANNPYHLGFFLVGAYQEILGNLHNLFGDTNSLDVQLLEDGTFVLQDLVYGDTVHAVLNAAHFNIEHLIASYTTQLNKSPLSAAKINVYLDELRDIFTQLTYLSGTKNDNTKIPRIYNARGMASTPSLLDGVAVP